MRRRSAEISAEQCHIGMWVLTSELPDTLARPANSIGRDEVKLLHFYGADSGRCAARE